MRTAMCTDGHVRPHVDSHVKLWRESRVVWYRSHNTRCHQDKLRSAPHVGCNTHHCQHRPSSLCIDMCTGMRIDMHRACVYAYRHVHRYVYRYVCRHVHRHIQACIRHACRHVHAHAYRHVHAHVYRHVNGNMNGHVYRHVYGHVCRHV